MLVHEIRGIHSVYTKLLDFLISVFPIKYADWTFKKALNKLLSFEKRNLEILPLVKSYFKIIQKSF